MGERGRTGAASGAHGVGNECGVGRVPCARGREWEGSRDEDKARRRVDDEITRDVGPTDSVCLRRCTSCRAFSTSRSFTVQGHSRVRIKARPAYTSGRARPRLGASSAEHASVRTRLARRPPAPSREPRGREMDDTSGLIRLPIHLSLPSPLCRSLPRARVPPPASSTPP